MTICPICHASGPPSVLCQILWFPDVLHDLCECPQCHMRFTTPWPTDKQFDRFYHPGYYTFNAEQQEGKGWYWARYLTSWKPKGRFLDVGCATGHFIHGIRKFSGWEVAGVELSKAAAQYAVSSLKLEVREGNLEEARYPDASFDLVHVNNVLEHVTNPLDLLKECRRLLKPDGGMYLSIPHGLVDSNEYMVFKNRFGTPPFNHNGHLLYFSPKAFSLAFEQAGLTVERAYTTNIKRGLKLMGWWPRKWNWDQVYRRQESSNEPQSEVPIQTGTWQRPKWYHWWRNAKGEIFRLPGIHPVGLDLVFFLRKN